MVAFPRLRVSDYRRLQRAVRFGGRSDPFTLAQAFAVGGCEPDEDLRMAAVEYYAAATADRMKQPFTVEDLITDPKPPSWLTRIFDDCCYW